MKTSAWVSLTALFAAVVVIGCGGGGGGGGGSNGGSGGGNGAAPEPGQYLEFVGINRAGFIDPLKLKVGDDIQVEVVNYDGSHNRTVLNGSGWFLSDTTHLSINSTGRIRVLSRPPGVFSISANTTVAGLKKVVQQDCAVPVTSSTTISGKVVSDNTGTGVEYVQVTMYDKSNQKIGGARTGAGGAFQFEVPANFDSFTIEGKTVPMPKFFRAFIYKSKIYAMDDPLQCPFRITIVQGKNNSLLGPMSLWLQENGPPPPPDGCKP